MILFDSLKEDCGLLIVHDSVRLSEGGLRGHDGFLYSSGSEYVSSFQNISANGPALQKDTAEKKNTEAGRINLSVNLNLIRVEGACFLFEKKYNMDDVEYLQQ